MAMAKAEVTPREADDIANLAFIGDKTNRAISDKSASGLPFAAPRACSQ